MKEPDTDTFEDPLGSHRPEAMPLHPYLFIVLECDRPASGGARYMLTGIDEVVVGRAGQRGAERQMSGGVSRLRIGVPGRSMSSTHARLLSTSDGWVLEDARSTNGSFVNGKRVERQTLQDGDLLELGHTVFSVRTAVATPQGTAAAFDSLETPPAAAGLATLLPVLGTEYGALARFAPEDIPILLLGETGTGKEVVARAVHELSGRPGPFVAVNCGAMPAALVESQLFGHVRGSFSGASRDEPGFFRSADKGTLLLDEIGDFPEPAQAALLRVLQEHEVVPVGSSRPISVDVRVIAATHRPLESLVQQHRFRADLFARLDGHRSHLPRLKARREDLGLMIADILGRSSVHDGVRFTTEAGLALGSHDWPFNIRELVQHVKRGLILAGRDTVTKSQLGFGTVPSLSPPPPAPPLSPEQAELKRRLMLELEEHGGNVAEVARAMETARMQVHRWMKRFGLDPGAFRGRMRS